LKIPAESLYKGENQSNSGREPPGGNMERRYLLGNEAIAHGCLESPISFVSGYPGTPSSEVIEVLSSLPDRSYYAEWSVNEKVALENALAAAWCGIRALCTMKHVGLNVAADPLMTSAYTGVTGGLVIMAADDPFAHSSQNEQDSRMYAKFARIPCLDPATIQEAHDMIRDAFSLSEELGLPVLFRPTTRICHSKGDVELGPVLQNTRKGEFHRDPRQYVVIPAHTRILHKKLNEKQPKVRKKLHELGYNHATIRGRRAIIASGIAATYVQEVLPSDISFMKIGAYPIDEEWLTEFVRLHDEVLVVEELAPMLEEAVREVAAGVRIFGKKDGHSPWEGELAPDSVARIMESCGFSPAITFPRLLRFRNSRPARQSSVPAACIAQSFLLSKKSSGTEYTQVISVVIHWVSSSVPWTQQSVWEPQSQLEAEFLIPAKSGRSLLQSVIRRSCIPASKVS
jgi:indolepyruvate ferredoxin oxidoreductase alpha subunit